MYTGDLIELLKKTKLCRKFEAGNGAELDLNGSEHALYTYAFDHKDSLDQLILVHAIHACHAQDKIHVQNTCQCTIVAPNYLPLGQQSSNNSFLFACLLHQGLGSIVITAMTAIAVNTARLLEILPTDSDRSASVSSLSLLQSLHLNTLSL